MTFQILVALISGLASGLLLVVPLPTYIAGLGWGWPTAGIAAAIAALCGNMILTPIAGITHFLAFGVPTVVICWLATLSRLPPGAIEGDVALESSREWYPPGRLVLWLVTYGAVLTIFAILLIGSDIDTYRATVRRGLDANALNWFEEMTNQELTEGDTAVLVDTMVRVFPGLFANTWLAISLISLWLGGRIVRASGRLSRPWPDLALIEYPAITPILLALAIGAMLLPGLLGIVAGGIASILLAAYLLMGLSIIHFITRPYPMRALVLSLVYISLFLLGQIVAIVVTVIGLGEPLLRLRQRLSSGSQNVNRRKS